MRSPFWKGMPGGPGSGLMTVHTGAVGDLGDDPIFR
jgi:hypothetical protein